MNSPPSPQSGFTVVELLVVMLIIGLVLSLTIPRLSNPNREAQLAALQLASLLNDASTVARTNEASVALMYNPGQRTFTLQQSVPSSTPSVVNRVPVPGASSLKLPPDVSVTNLPSAGGLSVMVSYNELGRWSGGYSFFNFGTNATQAAVTPDAVVQAQADGGQSRVDF